MTPSLTPYLMISYPGKHEGIVRFSTPPLVAGLVTRPQPNMQGFHMYGQLISRGTYPKYQHTFAKVQRYRSEMFTPFMDCISRPVSRLLAPGQDHPTSPIPQKKTGKRFFPWLTQLPITPLTAACTRLLEILKFSRCFCSSRPTHTTAVKTLPCQNPLICFDPAFTSQQEHDSTTGRRNKHEPNNP